MDTELRDTKRTIYEQIISIKREIINRNQKEILELKNKTNEKIDPQCLFTFLQVEVEHFYIGELIANAPNSTWHKHWVNGFWINNKTTFMCIWFGNYLESYQTLSDAEGIIGLSQNYGLAPLFSLFKLREFNFINREIGIVSTSVRGNVWNCEVWNTSLISFWSSRP